MPLTARSVCIERLHLLQSSVFARDAAAVSSRAVAAARRSRSTICWNSSAMRSPFSVTVFSPSTNTGATGTSPVPGRLMPMLACLRFARTVHDAAHHRHVMFFDAGIARRASPASARAGTSGCARPAPGRYVLVVRPQPGHAITIGVNERRPMVCRISCATMTSCVRSPPGSGVSETRIVSPMPSCSSTRQRRRRGDDALDAHAGLGQAEVQRVIAARARVRGKRRSGPARRSPCTTG